jgi:chemotaxis protein methyltransferase CheR
MEAQGMGQRDQEDLEIDLLLEGIHERYGYDFRSYARASVERRVRIFRAKKGFEHVADLISPCIHDPAFFSELAQHFSIAVTEMFRDPQVYKSVRDEIAPILSTYPFVKVWLAGCATGEEAYSLAIVLKESSLLDKTTIFGTDFNDYVLDQARDGVFPIEAMREATENYQKSGGKNSFSEYYSANYGQAAIGSALKGRINFANHNLTVDTAFSEMHLVFCRNVLIYFNRELQDRALRLFAESLVRGGFLVLGTREDLQFSAVADDFEIVDLPARIYRKRAR